MITLQDLTALQCGAAGIALSADIDFGVRRLVAESEPAVPDWPHRQANGEASVDVCYRPMLTLQVIATVHLPRH